MFFVAFLLCVSAQLNPTEIIALHNAARKNISVSAANMLAIFHDSRLDSTAQNFADNCDQTFTAGFNTYLFSSSSGVSFSQAFTSWLSEGESYEVVPNLCSASGNGCKNYTQIVWASSSLIGCAVGCGGRLLVCAYESVGNLYGAKPYYKGPPCSQCPVVAPVCSDNLCQSVASINQPPLGNNTNSIVEITAPLATAAWTRGIGYIIKWEVHNTTEQPQQAVIYYTTTPGLVTPQTVFSPILIVSNTGSFLWSVPMNWLESESAVRLAIQLSGSSIDWAVSDVFTLVQPQAVRVILEMSIVSTYANLSALLVSDLQNALGVQAGGLVIQGLSPSPFLYDGVAGTRATVDIVANRPEGLKGNTPSDIAIDLQQQIGVTGSALMRGIVSNTTRGVEMMYPISQCDNGMYLPACPSSSSELHPEYYVVAVLVPVGILVAVVVVVRILYKNYVRVRMLTLKAEQRAELRAQKVPLRTSPDGVNPTKSDKADESPVASTRPSMVEMEERRGGGGDDDNDDGRPRGRTWGPPAYPPPGKGRMASSSVSVSAAPPWDSEIETVHDGDGDKLHSKASDGSGESL